MGVHFQVHKRFKSLIPSNEIHNLHIDFHYSDGLYPYCLYSQVEIALSPSFYIDGKENT